MNLKLYLNSINKNKRNMIADEDIKEINKKNIFLIYSSMYSFNIKNMISCDLNRKIQVKIKKVFLYFCFYLKTIIINQINKIY